MRKFILSLIWMVVAAMPTLNAQQASPSQNHCDATNLETQGGAEPGFSAAKGSTDSADNSNQ